MTSQRDNGLGGAITTAESLSSGLASLLTSIRKSWPIVLAAVILAVGVSLLYTRTLPRVYQSTAMIEFDPNAVRPLDEKADPTLMYATYWDNHEYYETQYKIITSDRVLSQVVRDLNLESYPQYGGVRGPSTPSRPMADMAAALREQIIVEPVKNSRLALVHVENTDAELARRVCDAVVATYIAQNLQYKIDDTSEAFLWLSGQIETLKKDLNKDEDQVNDFKVKNQLPTTSINDSASMIRIEMTAFDEALTHTRTKKQELLARYQELSKIPSDNPDLLPSSELLSSGQLQQLRQKYESAVEERQSLMAEGKGENHPLVRSAESRVEETKTALLNEIANIKGAVQRDLAVIERQEAGEAALYNEAKQRAVALNMKEIEYRRLDRTRDEDEKLYTQLVERMKDTDLARRMRSNNIRPVDPATDPKSPIRPRPMVNVLLAVVIGIFLGVALAWLRQQLDNSVKVPEDVEQKLGLTFIGLLPEHAEDGELRSGGKGRGKRAARRRRPSVLASELVVHEHPVSAIGEAARSVRTNLMFMNPDNPYRRILVTSAAPAEGKTTVACSIAIAMAQGGQRTCIVDCDLRRPRMHRIFDRAGDVGLTNLLVGDASLDDLARPTVVKNLWCIPAGPTPPNPADMLHSERFRKFLSELSERFDRVIIDSPPIVAVTDAAILSTLVDTTVFVIRAFKTSLTLSRQGMRALGDVGAPIAGAVLNAVDFNRLEYNYYYGYGYYHQRQRYAYGPKPPPADDDAASSSPPN